MKYKLSDICFYVKSKVAVSTLTDVNYISTENMLTNKGGITTATALPSTVQTQAYQKNDVLISNIRPYFKKIWFAENNGGCSNDVLVLRAEEGIDAKFLYYVLADDAFFDYSTATSKGTKMPRGDKTAIMQYNVSMFDIETQKKISGLLSDIDTKIALNKKINKNLEEQASLLFKSWFVDFEPFNEALVNTPAGIATPASLKMLQIADIPHTLETGKRPKGGAVSEGVPSIGAENVKKLGEVNFSSAKYIPEDFASKMKTGAVNGYELMLYKDGGKPGTFTPHFSMFGEDFPYKRFFINEHVFKLDFYNHGFNEFAYFYMQTDYPYHWLANNGGKAAVPGINQQDVNSIWIFSPDNPKVKEFCNWVQPIFTTIFTNCSQNLKLANLRDSLLPKLISGELDVSDFDI